MKKHYIFSLVLAMSVLGNAQQVNSTQFGQHTIGVSQNSTLMQRMPTPADPAMWAQPVSTADNKYAIVSTYYLQNGWGVYSADDFKLDNQATINSVLFYGSQYNAEAQELIQSVNIYFYADNNGVPVGSPESQGSELKKLSFPINSEFVTIEPGVDAFLGNKIYYVNLKGIFGEGVSLPAGKYWMSIVFDIDMDSSNFDDRFSWADSQVNFLSQPKLISSELGISNWTSVPEIGFPVSAFAFTLYGEGQILSTQSAELKNLEVYPNPAVDHVYLSGTQVEKIQQISAINSIGQMINLHFNNGRVDVSSLKTGVYILQIKTSNGIVSKKMIKK